MQQINQNMSIKRVRIASNKELLAKLRLGDRNALSRAITLIESQNAAHRAQAEQLLAAAMPLAGKSVRIGITGVPGVGKSTFIEQFGLYLTRLGKKVAVLAVDPSSERSGGSILGDKTRMNELAQNTEAFIRPSPSAKSLGGVTRATRESIVLCEAAGFDVILIETVGVGQSETAVHNMVDFFLLLMIAGAGDELQGIKRGIMEMADGFVITKSDGANIVATEQSKREIETALRFYPKPPSAWQANVWLVSALEKIGIESVWNDIQNYVQTTQKSGYFSERRKAQELSWFKTRIQLALEHQFLANTKLKTRYDNLLKQIETNTLSASEASALMLNEMK